MILTFEVLLGAELFVVFEVDAVASAVSLLSLQITMGSATDEQGEYCFASSDSGSSVVVVRKEGSNSDGVNFSSGTISVEKRIIPLHLNPLAARQTEAGLFHASEICTKIFFPGVLI
jgi:hypothetical protein